MKPKDAVVGENVLWAFTKKEFRDTVLDFGIVTVAEVKAKSIKTTNGKIIPFSRVHCLRNIDAFDFIDEAGRPHRVVKVSLEIKYSFGTRYLRGFDLVTGHDIDLVEGEGKGSLKACNDVIARFFPEKKEWDMSSFRSFNDFERTEEGTRYREAQRRHIEKKEIAILR